MAEPHDESSAELLERLAAWRDVVIMAVSRYALPRVVQAFDVPGAVTVKLSPDADGQETARRLISWCVPELALVIPPRDDDIVFAVALLSATTNVVLVCGEFSGDEDSAFELQAEASPELVSEVHDSVTLALDRLSGADTWHPAPGIGGELDDMGHVLEYLFPNVEEGSASDDEERRRDIAVGLLSMGPLRDDLRRRRREQKELHRERLAEHAEQVAEELIGSEIGSKLWESTTQAERVRLIYNTLIDEDPCITRAACRPVAQVIPLLKKRMQRPRR